MAKLFSVLSWNVEHFKGEVKERVDDVTSQIKNLNPDIFALYEVEGKEVFSSFTSAMPNYNFHITEGPQTQEILFGAKNNFSSFFTQKLEFKSGNQFLRPGLLLTVNIDSQIYSLLFLHTKSGTDPLGLGLRDDMFKRACTFRNVLEGNTKNWKTKYLFLGDLNTMGMEYPFGKAISAKTEIKKLAHKEAQKVKMRFLKKDEPASWWNGSKSKILPSNLDQVVASDNLKFKKYSGAEVTVLGWPKESTSEKKDKWIKRYSDHGIIYFEVLV